MSREEEITGTLLELQKIVGKLNGWLQSENMSARMIRDDIRHMHGKKDELMKQNADILAANQEAEREGKKILASYKEEAEKLISVERENLVAASKDREQAKQELLKAQEIRYKAEKERDEILSQA